MFYRFILLYCCVHAVIGAEWDGSVASGKFTISSDCTVSSQVEVGEMLSLTGVINGSGILPRVYGGGSNRLFSVGSGRNLTVQRLNLTGGNATSRTGNSHYGGVVTVYYGHFTAIDSVMTGNTAEYGGALHIRYSGTILV